MNIIEQYKEHLRLHGVPSVDRNTHTITFKIENPNPRSMAMMQIIGRSGRGESFIDYNQFNKYYNRKKLLLL